MKKGLIISLCVVGFGLLIFRGFFLESSHLRDERTRYMKSLNYDFSAEVDSLHAFNNQLGNLYFHVTAGSFDRHTERDLNRGLKYYSNLRVINRRPHDLGIRTNQIKDCKPGDSLRINSITEKLRVFRQGKLIFENRLIIDGQAFK